MRFKEIAELQAITLSDALTCHICPLDLFILRKEAARTVYATKKRTNNAREASWQEIYELIFSSLGLPDSKPLHELCYSIELDYEKRRLSLNSVLYDVLANANRSEKRLICLSDMYLPSQHIKELIDAAAGEQTDFHVYSSGDYGFGKGCGALFHQLANDYDLSLDEIVHCGDNYVTDYAVPRDLGIKSIYLPRSVTWRLATRARTYWFLKTYPAL